MNGRHSTRATSDSLLARVVVVGNTGSGKTTLARALAQKLHRPNLELDEIAHQADWRMIDPAEFRERVASFIETNPSWVVEGNYEAVRELVWSHAQQVIWLDPERIENMRAVVWRTVRRLVTREVLWNGNREPLSNLYSLDPNRSVIAWAWQKHGERRASYSAAINDPRWDHLCWVRLMSRSAALRWLEDGEVGAESS